VVSGQFDPTRHRAIWPSTGNYARGGIAISRIMASRGVAILPAGMSQERFDWLDEWCANPAEDVIRTVGTESNVKEIYDACNELALDPGNFVLNQFCEFGNHLGHYEVTGRALAHVFETVRAQMRADSGRDLTLAAFTSATGSAGTIAAGAAAAYHFAPTPWLEALAQRDGIPALILPAVVPAGRVSAEQRGACVAIGVKELERRGAIAPAIIGIVVAAEQKSAGSESDYAGVVEI
jgi:hypothetical protein